MRTNHTTSTVPTDTATTNRTGSVGRPRRAALVGGVVAVGGLTFGIGAVLAAESAVQVGPTVADRAAIAEMARSNGLSGLSPASLAATAVPDPAPIAVEVLSRHAAFPDDVSLQVKRKLPGQGADVLNLKDAGHVVTARLVIQPGAAFPWHTHPGPVIVTVTQGELVYQQASDCVERRYGPQEAFVDPGPKTHTAWNPGDEETELMATFFGVPMNADGTGGAVTIVDPDQSNRCD